MNKIAAVLATLALSLLLAACGNKGPLVRPSNLPPADTAPGSTPPAALPAPDPTAPLPPPAADPAAATAPDAVPATETKPAPPPVDDGDGN